MSFFFFYVVITNERLGATEPLRPSHCCNCGDQNQETSKNYLYGSGGYLDVMQLVQGALPVNKVGGSQLMQSF